MADNEWQRLAAGNDKGLHCISHHSVGPTRLLSLLNGISRFAGLANASNSGTACSRLFSIFPAQDIQPTVIQMCMVWEYKRTCLSGAWHAWLECSSGREGSPCASLQVHVAIHSISLIAGLRIHA